MLCHSYALKSFLEKAEVSAWVRMQEHLLNFSTFQLFNYTNYYFSSTWLPG